MNVSHVVSSLVCTCSLGPSEGAIFVIARHLLRDSNDNRNERCDRGDSLSPENHKCQHEEMTFMQRCEGAGGSSMGEDGKSVPDRGTRLAEGPDGWSVECD